MSGGTAPVRVLCAAGTSLGEGIRYDLAADALDWVDVEGKALHGLSADGHHARREIDLEPRHLPAPPSRPATRITATETAVSNRESHSAAASSPAITAS